MGGVLLDERFIQYGSQVHPPSFGIITEGVDELHVKETQTSVELADDLLQDFGFGVPVLANVELLGVLSIQVGDEISEEG